MQNQVTPLTQKIQECEKLGTSRTVLCVALLAAVICNGVFLGIMHFALIPLQLPAIVIIIILSKKPSFGKELLPQQYIGFSAVVISTIKSIFIVVYTIWYVVVFFSDLQIINKALHDGYSTTISIIPVSMHSEIYPTQTPSDGKMSNVYAAILTILCVFLVLSDLLTLYILSYIAKTTYSIIKIIREAGFTTNRISPNTQPMQASGNEQRRNNRNNGSSERVLYNNSVATRNQDYTIMILRQNELRGRDEIQRIPRSVSQLLDE